MLKRVSILVKDNPYNTLRAFSSGLQTAFKKKCIQMQWVDAGIGGHLPTEALQAIYAFAPDLTLSFSETDPLPDGRYLWDVVQIPHLAALVDPAVYFMHQINSRYLFHSCIDQEDVCFFNDLGFYRSFFLPHAVDPTEISKEKVDKTIEILFMGTCYDYRVIEQGWKKRLNALSIKVLQAAIELFFTTPFLRFTSAIDQILKEWKVDEGSINRFELMKELDFYVRSYDRIALLQEISLHHPLTIVGGGPSFSKIGGNWQDHFSKTHQVSIYPEIPYKDATNWIKRAKILLNSSPCYYQGSHERILMGLSCGCSVLTSCSKYVEESFGLQAGVDYYTPGKWKESLDKINYFLQDSNYEILSKKGALLVENAHTWKHRVETLLTHFPDLYSSIFL